MKKQIYLLIFIFIFFMITNVQASGTAGARIGNQFFDSLEDAIKNANSTDTINLISDTILDESLEIHKTVNINLNNHNIVADEKVFFVQGGSLNLSGSGKVIEKNPNYGAIMIKGSNDPSKQDFSTISVGSGITLEGWSGIFINHENSTAYGILVNMNGSINAIDDKTGSPGIGIYVNGNIQNEDNSPIINLSNTANIVSTGTGIYAAGYATYNINGAYIKGEESGIGIKSGVFNILNGTIIGSGSDKTPTSGNNNGINPSGSAIQIESNTNYEGNIVLNIKNGKFESNNSNVIYEYTVSNSPTSVKSIDISGGTFISNNDKNVFLLSNSFKNNRSKFITGGLYSSDPSNYLKNGYSVSQNKNSLYEVINSTLAVVNMNNKNTNSNIPIIIITVLAILGIFTYLCREKIYEFIKSI